MRRVLIIDTSILCCWLQIPNKETCGPIENRWDYSRVEKYINDKLNLGYFLVLPLATLLETGNHIANANSLRFEQATALANYLQKAAESEEPWAAFTEQAKLFDIPSLRKIAEKWPDLASTGMSIGDYLIKDVAEYYAESGMTVDLLTGDEGLKAYEPKTTIQVPRRRGG